MKKTNLTDSNRIKKNLIPVLELNFSFKYFDNSDNELCPPHFQETYTQILMQRLRELSKMSPMEFFQGRNKSLRIHTHEWSKTARPQGFKHLPQEHRDQPAWQFQLSQSEYGRVHGFFLGNTFLSFGSIDIITCTHNLYSLFGNVLSVALLTFPMMPIAIYFLKWWLMPQSKYRKTFTAIGTLLPLALYLLEIWIFGAY